MAYQRVPNTAQIDVLYSLFGQSVLNTYHAYSSSGYNQADLDLLAAQIDTTPAIGILADLSQYISYVSTTVKGLDQEYDLTSYNNNHAAAGSKLNRSFPGQVCFCVSQLTGFSGRASRGRVYISGIPIDNPYVITTAGNQLTVTAAAAYTAHVDGFRNTIEAIGIWDAVIVSRYHNGSKRSEAITTKWLTTAYNSVNLRTLRGRASE